METVPTNYEDINKWSQQQNDLLSQQQQLQQDLVNQQTQKSIDELEYNKSKIDKDTQKQTRGLYTNYQKMANNYGVQAEQQAQMGLNNSGYAETSKINLFNNYQKNVTDTLNNANQLKADFDFQINQARQQGNITMAQNQLALYQQKMQLLTQEYDMRKQAEALAYQQSRDLVSDNQWQQSFDYQKSRDTVSDKQWQQSFDYQKSRDAVSDSQWQQSFDYQKSRDAVADSQWQKQYELSKKAYTSSKRRSSSSKKSSGNSSGNNGIQKDNGGSNKPSQDEVAKNMKVMQGVNKDGSPYTNVKDGLTGKVYSSPAALFEAYGY